VCSATLQTGLRQQLYHCGWFKKGVDSVVKVRSELPAGETWKPEKNVAAPDVTLAVVEHCALIFSEDGSVRDVGDAMEPKWSPEPEDSTRGEEVQTWTDPQDSDLPIIHAQPAEGELGVYPGLQITELIVSVRRVCRNAFCLSSCCDGRGSSHIRDGRSEDGITGLASVCTSRTRSARPACTRH
jgi:hypothetical protein